MGSTDALSLRIDDPDQKFVANSIEGALIELFDRGSASFAAGVSAWQPNTAYVIDQYVTNGGILYVANANFTSGATFLATSWTAKTAAAANTVPGLIKTAGSASAITGTDTTTAVTPKAGADALHAIVDPLTTRVSTLEAGGTSAVAQADVVVAATTTDAILASAVFVANELAIGDTVLMVLDVSDVNSSGLSADAVYKVKIGANVLIQNAISFAFATGTSFFVGEIQVRIRIKSATTVAVSFKMMGANGVAAQTTAGLISANKGFIGINPAAGFFVIGAANQFDVAVSWSAASASNNVTVNDVYVGVIKGS